MSGSAPVPTAPESTVGRWSKLLTALGTVSWATVFGGLIVTIAAVAGGVVVIVGKSSLDFSEYVNDLSKLAVGVGLVAVGRGIHNAGTKK
jgi:hypothetical protein